MAPQNLGSVAGTATHAEGMVDATLLTFILSGCALGGAAVGMVRTRRSPPARHPVLGIGTVCVVSSRVTIEVESVHGHRFVGRLHDETDAAVVAALRPGELLLVAFDPAAREELSLPDDIVAVRAEFDQMLLGKGLVSDRQLDLIRHGVRSRAVVTAMDSTGIEREDYREVRLDLMVSRIDGGQFAARETTLVPASSMTQLSPGCLVDTYYRRGDESTVAVSIPPA